MRPAILLFAKAPVAGRVKTRLSPHLTPGQAAALHERMVSDTWSRLEGLGDLELHTDVATEAWPQAAVRRLQVEGDLGARMYHALEAALGQGRPRVMIAGSDAPQLPAAQLRDLLNADADVALGPAEDGGYYAISCRRIHPRMFEGVRWSTRSALSDTAAAVLRCALSVHVGAPWYDIDTPEDLGRLPESWRMELCMPLKEGDPAPAIPLLTDEGAAFDWAGITGRNAVLFFYPRADTPG